MNHIFEEKIEKKWKKFILKMSDHKYGNQHKKFRTAGEGWER